MQLETEKVTEKAEVKYFPSAIRRTGYQEQLWSEGTKCSINLTKTNLIVCSVHV